jgi:hypothetical protein
MLETKRQNFNITPEQEAKLNWLQEAIGTPNIKETILRSLDVMCTLKQNLTPGNKLFIHTPQGEVRLLIPELESNNNEDWLYLVKRPHQWRKQLYIKGRKLLASTVWQDLIINQMSKEEAADNWNLPLAVIEEVITYCETHQDLIKLEAKEEGYRLEEKGVSLES